MVKIVLSSGVGVDNKIVHIYKETEVSKLLSGISYLIQDFQDDAKQYLNEGTIYSCHIDISVFNTFEDGDIF